MYKKLFSLLIVIALLVEFVAVAPTESVKASSYSSMRSYVVNVLKKNNLRGKVVVINNGHAQQINWGYGWLGKRIENGNSQLVYPIFSLQKLLTGAMIVQLINEKLKTKQSFSQYTKISRWYPNLKNADNITVGNLLTHTSGIIAGGTETNHGNNLSESEAISWTVNNINNSQSGTIGKFSYNNSNFILLAGIIRDLTGKSYAENFEQRIIRPLGLSRTYIYSSLPSSLITPVSYVYNKKQYTNPVSPNTNVLSQLPGTGNVYSTPYEFYKIHADLSNGKILSKADFYYLTHLKASSNNYSGGVYVKNNSYLDMAYGNLSGAHYANWFELTSDNRYGLIVFLNQAGSESSVKSASYQILNHIKANTFTRY